MTLVLFISDLSFKTARKVLPTSVGTFKYLNSLTNKRLKIVFIVQLLSAYINK
jgi:hypothetical protein